MRGEGLEYCAREGGLVEGAKFAVQVAVVTAHGNHGGIVGGVGEFGNVDFPNALFFHRLEGVAQSRVGAHSTRPVRRGECRWLSRLR